MCRTTSAWFSWAKGSTMEALTSKCQRRTPQAPPFKSEQTLTRIVFCFYKEYDTFSEWIACVTNEGVPLLYQSSVSSADIRNSITSAMQRSIRANFNVKTTHRNTNITLLRLGYCGTAVGEMALPREKLTDDEVWWYDAYVRDDMLGAAWNKNEACLDVEHT